jgi:hypothetical protein
MAAINGSNERQSPRLVKAGLQRVCSRPFFVVTQVERKLPKLMQPPRFCSEGE